MTDRELLELAAKAAGLVNPQYAKAVAGNWNIYHGDLEDPRECWNPLDDDGDALRLAVKLGLQVTPGTYRDYEATAYSAGAAEAHERVHSQQDLYTATRRAIVRAAAAEIGRNMP